MRWVLSPSPTCPDSISHGTRKRQASTRDKRERYVDILDRLCEQGRLGQKTGAGWYTYGAGAKRGTPDPVVREAIEQASQAKGIARKTLSDEQLLERALGAMLNEALLVLEDRIAERGSDIDLVMVNGYGFPAERGGILLWASRQDQAALNRILDEVAADIGFGFRRADLDHGLRKLRDT